MTEAFVYETSQVVELLEQIMISSEAQGSFEEESINEIFRFMHTIKGSAAMMMFNDMSHLAHKLEDIFYVIREEGNLTYDYTLLTDLILESIDYIKIELMKIKDGEVPDGDQADLMEKVTVYLEDIKPSHDTMADKPASKPQKYYIRSTSQQGDFNYFKAIVWFKKETEMVSIRAYTIIHNIVDMVEEVHHSPQNIIEDDTSDEIIKNQGFCVWIKTSNPEETIKEYLNNTVFLDRLVFETMTEDQYHEQVSSINEKEVTDEIQIPKTSQKFIEKKLTHDISLNTKQTTISVNVEKLDMLMDMVGELVISEAMVTQNPEITSLEIESFDKSSRLLHKITGELQDMVMAIRMVPLSTTFLKMNRIVRDMTRKLDKKVKLEIMGEETEVDKNIIEKIADPLMHIIRNSIDHGIETKEERIRKDKNLQGTITLEAKNSGSDVLIIIRDDGKGLDKKKIYEKAIQNGVINKTFEDMSDRELYNLILQPGFSTKEEVTEFSGRGVGMDVVAKNIESAGGSVIVDSLMDKGTTIILKIPLTLAIIEGMNLRVGESRFTLPIVSIRESFRPENSEIFQDTEGREMIMVRGLCYPIVRLHKFYSIPSSELEIENGILIMVENDEKACCIFADELLGQQQVVVKGLPEYVKRFKEIKGLGGCTLLGDGSISLILDVGEFNLANVNEKILM